MRAIGVSVHSCCRDPEEAWLISIHKPIRRAGSAKRDTGNCAPSRIGEILLTWEEFDHRVQEAVRLRSIATGFYI